jgi:ABC-type nitrate/sulfonate/bicarbonate transport system ATPase subunit
LSGGQVQRVALARTFAADSEIILADEPYAALDHHTRDKMHEWLLDILRESRKTVIFVTHYIEEAIFLSDRVVVVRDNRFVADLVMPFPKPRDPDIRYRKEFLDIKYEILLKMEGK